MCDSRVAIIGAGIAGTACAIALAKAGIKTTLVAPADGRNFIVGESLPGAALPLLRKLGVRALADIMPPSSVSQCTGNFSAWGSDLWHLQDAIQNPQSGGWHIDRAAFGQALCNMAKTAGVEWQNAKVEAIRQSPNGYSLVLDGSKKPVNCNYLVDASGRFGIARKLLTDWPKRHVISPQVANVAWFVAATNDIESYSRIKSTEQGWWYSALYPLANHASKNIRVVCQFGLAKDIKPNAIEPQRWLQTCNQLGVAPVTINANQQVKAIETVDASVAKLQNSYMPNHQGKGFSLAIGDASLSLDPLSSQGMFFALYTAIKASKLLCATTDDVKGDLPAALLKSYQQQIDKVFMHHQKARMQFLCAETRYPQSAFWNITSASQAFAKTRMLLASGS